MLFTYANNAQIIWCAELSSSHHAMRYCYHSVSIARSRTLRKWCYTPLQHDFALDPIIPPFDFHFRIYKRDLAILTERNVEMCRSQSWRGKSAVFRIYYPLTLNGYSNFINAVKRQRNLGLVYTLKVYLRGVTRPCPLQHDFALDPIIPPFDFHFRIYKRDLAILTE
jgi:hypothetical protein